MKNILLIVALIVISINVVFAVNGLFIIDVQNCFLDLAANPNATLPVTGGSGVIQVVNNIRNNYGSQFPVVVRSQDWHCPHHVSFASTFGLAPFTGVLLTYTNQSGSPQLCNNNTVGYPQGINNEVNCTSIQWSIPQTLWPDHCVINTTDAAFAPGQVTSPNDFIIQKGNKCWVDSYSALYDNGHFTSTTLPGILKTNPITQAFVLGLAFDYCVFYTSMDLKAMGIDTHVIVDGTRFIDPSTNASATTAMLNAGIKLINYRDMCTYINCNSTTGTGSSTGSSGFSIIPSSLLLVLMTLIATIMLKN